MSKQKTVIAPLSNIECSECMLDDNIHLVHTPEHILDFIKDCQQKLFIRDPAYFPICLVVKGNKIPKNQIRKSLEDIILLFRLFKSGDVYYNTILYDNRGWFDNPDIEKRIEMLSVYYFIAWSHKGLESKFKVSEKELDQFIYFIKTHRGKEILERRAFKTFFRGYHDPNTDDRFLRNAIGLENVFLNDTEEISSLRYKFIDRGCYLLQLAEPLKEGAGAYAKPLQDIYKIRCKLVHSNEKPLDWSKDENIEIFKNADSFLRISLRLLLDDSNLARKGEIDKRKRACYNS